MEIRPWNPLSRGIRFFPTEVELVHYYLANKATNKPFQDPTNRFQEVELYNYTPHQLNERYGGLHKEAEMYFFVKKVLKHRKGKRLERRITNNSGYWRSTTSEIDIRLAGNLVGHRKILVYYSREERKTNWLMYEYRLPDNNMVQGDDWLLCQVYLNEMEETKYKTQLNLALKSAAMINFLTKTANKQGNPRLSSAPTMKSKQLDSDRIVPSHLGSISTDLLFKKAKSAPL